MNAITGHAPTAEPRGEVLKEGGRAAQIEIGFAGYAQLFEDRDGQPAGRIEVNAKPVSRVGSAILDIAPGMTSLQFTLPIVIRNHLVDKDGALLSTVTLKIALRIAVNVEPPNQAPSPTGCFHTDV